MERTTVSKLTLLSLVLAVCLLPQTLAAAQEVTVPAKIAESPEVLKAGARIYYDRCAFCHGLTGAGDGAAADDLDPRPRDFRPGQFKFRSTVFGALPTDEDLYRTVARGLPGTAMPAWQLPDKTLSDEEVWQVVHYLKTLIDPEEFDIKDPDNDPYKELIEMPDTPYGSSPEVVKKGFGLYVLNGCWKCHGMVGRGDGTESGTHTDDWGFPILVADLQKPWRIKNGSGASDLMRTFLGGFNNTPMPEFLLDDIFYKNASWDLAYFVEALTKVHDFEIQVAAGTALEAESAAGSEAKATISGDIHAIIQEVDANTGRVSVLTDGGEEGWLAVSDLSLRLTPKKPSQSDSSNVIIVSALREGPLPEDPDDPVWDEADPLDIPLSGQVLARPRIQTPAVDAMTVRSFYNEEKIVFLLEWNDRFEDRVHESKDDYPDPASFETTYLKLWGDGGVLQQEKREALRDSGAIQFPVNPVEGPEKPHFFLGGRGMPVNLWKWDSDKGDDGAVTEMDASGFGSAPAAQDKASQGAAGKGLFRNGRWKVVISRSLRTDSDKDVQIEPGKLLPISFYAWDGHNGEKGLLCSLSSWYYVLPEVPTPPKVYLIGIGAALAAGFIEFLLVRSRRRKKAGQ